MSKKCSKCNGKGQWQERIEFKNEYNQNEVSIEQFWCDQCNGTGVVELESDDSDAVFNISGGEGDDDD